MTPRLLAAISLLLVVALTLVKLREYSCQQPERLAALLPLGEY